MICTQFRTAKRETNAENQSLVKALPALERIVKQASDSLRRPGTPPTPGITALFGAGDEAEQQMYITFGGGRIYLVTAQAPTEDLNDDAVARIRQLVAETKIEVPGLNVGLTGEPVLELDEMAQSQKDTTLASIVSLLLCALIFIYGYQETGRPVKATLCLIVGLGYTMAFASGQSMGQRSHTPAATMTATATHAAVPRAEVSGRREAMEGRVPARPAEPMGKFWGSWAAVTPGFRER